MNRIEDYQNGTSPEKIKEEITTTRNHMDTTMEKIADKLDPSPYVESAADWAREKTENINGDSIKEGAQAVSDTVRNNPIPVALAGLAIASLFLPKRKSSNEKSLSSGGADREAQNPLTSVGTGNATKIDRINQRIYDPNTGEIASIESGDAGISKREKISQKANDLKQSIGESTSAAGEKFTDATQKAGESLSNTAARAKAKSADLKEKSSERFASGKENYPALMGLGAVAIGFLAALAIPRTRKEDELYGDKADELKARAAAKKDEFTNEVKEKINEKGLDPESLKDKAYEAVSEATDKVNDAVDDAADKVDEKIEEKRPE